MQKCDEIEDLDEAHSPRLYDKIKESEPGGIERISRNNMIKNKDGNVMVEIENITDR